MSNYQTGGYSRFHALLDTWKTQPQKIESQVKNLTDKARLLGTPLDTAEFRAILDEDERRLHDLATQMKTVSKELADEMAITRKDLSRNDLDMVTRGKNAINSALKKYEDIIKEISRKRQQSQSTNSSTLIDFGDDPLNQENLQQRMQLQQQMKMNNDLLHTQNEEQFIIEEQVQNVQVDVIQINHIMRDIGAIVSEQSPIIAEIEQNVTSATDHIIAGNQQLSSAAGHQKKYRKKLCWLLLIFLIIAVIVTIVIILKFK